MKKIINIFLVLFLIFILTSCIDENPDLNNDDGDDTEEMDNIINIYTLNDFHGAIFEDAAAREIGISKIGQFLKSEKEKKPDNTIILSAGDMFQGTALSSLTRGRVVVDLMNYIGFDAMAIGNHEFDWGVSEITRYVDGEEENGEADFDFLGANIFHLPTDEYVDWAKPYTILERGDLKIGILGLIGETLTSSIIGYISKDFVFTSQMDAIKKYVPIMRNNEGADIVIVVSHEDTRNLNYKIASLSGDSFVDAVVNGHTHNYYVFEENREHGAPYVGVQSGSNGKFIGHLVLELDLENKKVIDAAAGFVEESKLVKESSGVSSILNNYQEYIDISNELLGIASQGVSKDRGVIWAADTMQGFDESDFGLVNAGGIRSAGFPINAGDSIYYGSVFKMMPFENTVITGLYTGKQIKSLATSPGDIKFSSNFNISSINDEELYKLAIIDYVFYRDEQFFMQGVEITNHDELFRDLLINQIKESVEKKGKWYL